MNDRPAYALSELTNDKIAIVEAATTERRRRMMFGDPRPVGQRHGFPRAPEKGRLGECNSPLRGSGPCCLAPRYEGPL
jgi:hypothetical protein